MPLCGQFPVICYETDSARICTKPAVWTTNPTTESTSPRPSPEMVTKLNLFVLSLPLDSKYINETSKKRPKSGKEQGWDIVSFRIIKICCVSLHHLCTIQQPFPRLHSYTKNHPSCSPSLYWVISLHGHLLWKSNVSPRRFLETGGLGLPYWREAFFIGDFCQPTLSRTKFKCFKH